jgi:hypothetical protein
MNNFSKRLLFLISFASLFILQGCQFLTGDSSKAKDPISLIGSWEGTDTTVNADYKIVVQFQSDSLFQEFGSYEGEWKKAGIWEVFTSNGIRKIKLTYEESKGNPLYGEISYLYKDSLFIEIYDELHNYTFAWSLKRTKSEDGSYVMNNPIFKLAPYNPEGDSINIEWLKDSPTEEITSSTPSQVPPQTVQKKLISCTDCRGTGNSICGYCSGAKVLECSKCYGSGTIMRGKIFSPDTDGRGYTCPECAGRGSKMCSTCRGTGVNGICWYCYGKGQVFN